MLKKVMVNVGKERESAIKAIKAHSQKILADYNQAILIEVDEEDLKAIKAKGYRVRELTEKKTIKVGGYKVDTSKPEIRSSSAKARMMAIPTTKRTYHIVHFVGPFHPDWKSQLEQLGVILYSSVDEFSYLISIESNKVDDLLIFDFIDEVIPYFPNLKINPLLLTKDVQAHMEKITALVPEEIKMGEEAPETITFEKTLRMSKISKKKEEEVGNLEILLFDSNDLVSVLERLSDLDIKVINANGSRILIYANAQLIPELAKIEEIQEINPYKPPHLTNNVATGIIHADTLQNDLDLDGSGQVVGIADTGLDKGVNDNTMLADFRGRIVTMHALGRPGDASDIDNHGTHVAGSVLGDGSNSNGKIKGMAPSARVVFQSVMDSSRGLGGLPLDYRNGLFDVAQSDGAHIHTNSWGADDNGAYTIDTGYTDDFAFNNREFLILFSAGNEAPHHIGSPGGAKNVLTVGACESERPLPNSVTFPNSPMYPSSTYPGGPTWLDFDDQADNTNDVASFSSIGPVQNSRRKPDVVAPGTFILSTRSSVSTADTGSDGLSETGDEDGIFTHDEAVMFGLPGEPVLGSGNHDTPDAPSGSGSDVTQNYCYSNGTSMSTPITAGSCALLRQYLIEQRDHIPSASLLKALIINGAVDMGMGVPHNGQGWGRVDLENTLFPKNTKQIQFDDTLDNVVSTGDIKTYDVFVSTSDEPLAVTLVWRDPRGSTIQNRLHLRVIHVASGTITTSDDIGNILNNVQKVIIKTPDVGLYHIEVEGVSITTNIPELPPEAPDNILYQDYALVVANATGFSCNPSDIVQVIDCSGSMGFSGYMEPAKERAKQMIDILQINDKAGVVTFANVPNEIFPLTTINSQEDKDDACSNIDLITAAGMTDLREALSQGVATLGASTRPKAIVFLTDGKHTVSTAPPIDNAFLANIAAENIKVYTIGLGLASDYAVLNNIANQTGTSSVYSVESAADLHKLHEIYYNILGDVECGGLIHLQSSYIDIGKELMKKVNVDFTAKEVKFALSWEVKKAKIDFMLEDPSGKVYDSNSNEIFYHEESSHAFFRVSNPKAGTWKMRLVCKTDYCDHMQVTTAALSDSSVVCDAQIDSNHLSSHKLLLSLKVHYRNKPLGNGKARAIIVYPTQSIDTLLDQYARELEEIKVGREQLLKDTDDLELIKLGLLAAQYQRKGKDIFMRKTLDVELKEINDEIEFKEGVYSAFFDVQEVEAAGNFQVQFHFEVKNDEVGLHSCTKLVPVYMPRAVQKLSIKEIVAKRNRLWRYTIIGAKVVKADGTPATPKGGVKVSMQITQGIKTSKLEKVPYYRRGKYYIWRFWERGFKKGKATVAVEAKQGRVIVKKSQVVTL